MASLTIRKLDEGIKADLRVRSARNGRSVEEEVRVILREVLQGRPYFEAAPSQADPPAAEAGRLLRTAPMRPISPVSL